MKILVLSQHFWPESFRINQVVESLLQSGCKVTVLTGQPNYPEGQVFPGYRTWGASAERHPAGYNIFRVPLIPRGGGGGGRLILNYFSFMISAAVWGAWHLRGQRYDIVFVYATSPILQAIPAMVLAWLKGARLVTWVQDLWPDSLSATGFIRNSSLLKLVGIVVRWIYRRNDLLLVQSEAFLPSVISMAGQTRVSYHPNPGETKSVEELADAEVAFTLAPGFNVLFAGNFGSVQALDTVLDAAEQLLPYSDVRFVLVGSGTRSGWLQQQVASRGLSNVELPGRFGLKAMPFVFAQASVLLVSLTRHPAMAMTVPSKLQTYLAAGRPVIASLDGEGARAVQEAGAGLVCPAEDAKALASAVLELRSASDDDLERMGRNAQKYYIENYEPAALAQKLVAQFRSVCNYSSALPVETESK
jgi:glycosyltransferase involved in cell wall biosynthesis